MHFRAPNIFFCSIFLIYALESCNNKQGLHQGPRLHFTSICTTCTCSFAQLVFVILYNLYMKCIFTSIYSSWVFTCFCICLDVTKTYKKIILGGFSDKKWRKSQQRNFVTKMSWCVKVFIGWQGQEGYNGHTHSEHRDNCWLKSLSRMSDDERLTLLNGRLCYIEADRSL